MLHSIHWPCSFKPCSFVFFLVTKENICIGSRCVWQHKPGTEPLLLWIAAQHDQTLFHCTICVVTPLNRDVWEQGHYNLLQLLWGTSLETYSLPALNINTVWLTELNEWTCMCTTHKKLGIFGFQIKFTEKVKTSQCSVGKSRVLKFR